MRPQRFAVLWSGIEHRLRTYLAAGCADPSAVDDLAQEVALACWRKASTYDETRDFLAWVLGFARLVLLRLRRDHARSRLVLDQDLLETLETELVGLNPELETRRQALEHCRERLEGRARDLVELAYAHGLPLATVAERVGSSHGAVRTALCRIRERLHACIEARLTENAP